MNAIESGNAIAAYLNTVIIVVNGMHTVEEVAYADSTDEIVFKLGGESPKAIIFPRANFGMADWDEDHNDEAFYIVLDNEDIHHLMKFYRNDSLEIMRQLKEKF